MDPASADSETGPQAWAPHKWDKTDLAHNTTAAAVVDKQDSTVKQALQKQGSGTCKVRPWEKTGHVATDRIEKSLDNQKLEQLHMAEYQNKRSYFSIRECSQKSGSAAMQYEQQGQYRVQSAGSNWHSQHCYHLLPLNLGDDS